jgi:hypothetical protein
MAATNPARMLTTGILILILAAALALTGCSSDDPGPTTPGDPPIDEPPANTPPIPTVDNPQDQLPATSAFQVEESAELRNLSPILAGATPEMLDAMNEAYALDFRLPPGRSVLIADGRPCFPENLQWSLLGHWYGLSRSTSPAPLIELGAFGGSHYYLSSQPARWYFADVNCRNFGGQLASLTTEAENDFVSEAVQAVAPGTDFFIGLTDWERANNDWLWTSGDLYGWFNWAPGEPNNYSGEWFTHVAATGLWNDTKDDYLAHYVLERPTPLPALPGDDLPCADWGGSSIHLDRFAAPTVTPHVERRLYWHKVFQTAIGAGASYSEEHSYTYGTSETTGMSFGWSIGISVSAGWAFVSAEISSEFHQDFEHSVTISSEETVTRTYSADAPEGKIKLLALWQLRERYVITDGEGNDWSDPRFELAGPLPHLDQGLQQEYLQTILFDAP